MLLCWSSQAWAVVISVVLGVPSFVMSVIAVVYTRRSTAANERLVLIELQRRTDEEVDRQSLQNSLRRAEIVLGFSLGRCRITNVGKGFARDVEVTIEVNGKPTSPIRVSELRPGGIRQETYPGAFFKRVTGARTRWVDDDGSHTKDSRPFD